MANISNRMQERDGRSLLKTLARIPWPARFLGVHLQIPARQIYADAISENMLQSIVGGNILPAFADCDDELDLMMQITCSRRILDITPARHHGIGRFHEKEWWLSIRVVTHFTSMRRVVSSDTVDSMHWKRVLTSFDRNPGLRYIEHIHRAHFTCQLNVSSKQRGAAVVRYRQEQFLICIAYRPRN